MDSLGALRTFVRAAETRSFTAAGRDVGVSASAVGKTIARLERHLGVRLFHRSTRTVRLTAEGTRFLERGRRILAELEAAERELGDARGTPRGKLRVSMPLASSLMMPALSAFMRAYPEIELELDFSDRLVDVVGEGYDAVIRAGALGDSRLMSRTLGTFRLLLVGAPAYLEQRGVPRRPEDLGEHACLLHRFATSQRIERWPLRRGKKDLDLELPSAATANTIEPIIDLALGGHGIACLPDFAIRDPLATGALVTVLAKYTAHEGTFRVLWPSSRQLPTKLRVFVDFMAENLFPTDARTRAR